MENTQNQSQPTKKPSNQALWIIIILVVLAIASYGVYAYVLKNGNENTNSINTNQNTNTVANANTNTATNTNSTVNTNIVLDTNTATNTNLTTNANANTATNTNIDTSGWKTYEQTDFNVKFFYPSEWKLTEREENNFLQIQLLFSGLSITDVNDPWSLIYDNQAYINIGIYKDKVANWDYAPDLGRDISYVESEITFSNALVPQHTAVGYNHGIEGGRFPDNTVPQLSSQVVSNGDQYIWFRLYAGGDMRNIILQEFNEIILNTKITN